MKLNTVRFHVIVLLGIFMIPFLPTEWLNAFGVMVFGFPVASGYRPDDGKAMFAVVLLIGYVIMAGIVSIMWLLFTREGVKRFKG